MANTFTQGVYQIDTTGVILAGDINVKSIVVSPDSGGAGGFLGILKDKNGKVICNILGHVGVSVPISLGSGITFQGITADTLTNCTITVYV